MSLFKKAGTPKEGGPKGPPLYVKEGDVFVPVTEEAALTQLYRSTMDGLNVRYQNLVAHGNNWRTTTLIGLATLAVLAWEGNHLDNLSSAVPYPVPVDTLGVTLIPLAKEGERPVDPQFLTDGLIEFFENARTVSFDNADNADRVRKAVKVVEGEAYDFLISQLRKRKPSEISQTRGIRVRVKICIPLSPNTYQVEWMEDSVDPDGKVLVKDELYRATVKFRVEPKEVRGEFNRNPLGLVISSLVWDKAR